METDLEDCPKRHSNKCFVSTMADAGHLHRGHRHILVSRKHGTPGWRPRWLHGLVVLLACLLAIPAAQASSPKARAAWQGTVTHVTDGDTLWVRPQHGGAPRQIRLDGIDAPEICQPHGETARAALVGRVLGQPVQVRVRRTDDYGRALAHLSLQGQDVGRWMVTQGHAWSYRYRRDAGPYAAQEAQARAQLLGLFRNSRPERPHDFRKRHGACH